MDTCDDFGRSRSSGVEMRLAALAKAYELQQLLAKVIARPEYRPDSWPAHALAAFADVISYLRPNDELLPGVGATEPRSFTGDSAARRARLLADLVRLFAALPTDRQEHVVKQVAGEAKAQLRELRRPRLAVDNIQIRP
jgi:hypothetical protein